MRTPRTMAVLTVGAVLALAPVAVPSALATGGAPTTVYVDDSGPGHCHGLAAYTTITAGLAAVAVGGTVHVCGGTYHEDVLVDKAVTLVGENAIVSPDADDTTFLTDATGGNNAFTVTSPDVTIRNFTVRDATSDGIILLGDRGTIENVRATDNVINGINVDGSSHSKIRHNTVTNNGGGIELSNDPLAAGITLPGVSGTAAWDLVEDNTITDNPAACAIYLVDHAGSDHPGDWRGIHDNYIHGNYVVGNALHGFGGGVLFASPVPGGAVYNNRVQANTISTNGLPGIALHSHLPGQDLNGNVVFGNVFGTNNILGGEPNDDQTTAIFAGTHDPVTLTVEGNVITNNHFGVFTEGPVTVAHVDHNIFRGVDVNVSGLPDYIEPAM
jgi:nitrous oxidase accessory protein NosD